jgi:hypothetical protein
LPLSWDGSVASRSSSEILAVGARWASSRRYLATQPVGTRTTWYCAGRPAACQTVRIASASRVDPSEGMHRRLLETRTGRHVLTVVFVAFLVEAAGVPLPSRLLLLIAAAVAIDARQVATLVVVATAGSLIGDHVPYLAGAMTGPRILAFYCWITLGSAGVC